MKRFILIVVFASVLAGNIFAGSNDNLGLGTVFYGGYGYGPGIVLKLPAIPLYWGLNVSVRGIPDKQYFGVSISGDYHFFDQALPNTEIFNWFLGSGIIYTHSHFDGKNGLSARIPLGVYFSPSQKFDVILELSPQAGFYASANFSKVDFDYGMSGLLGVRYWF